MCKQHSTSIPSPLRQKDKGAGGGVKKGKEGRCAADEVTYLSSAKRSTRPDCSECWELGDAVSRFFARA